MHQMSLEDAVVEAGEEGRFYVTLIAKDSINDTDLENANLEVSVDRVRVEDASGAVVTSSDSDTDDLVEDVTFEDSTADDDASIKSSSDSRDAGLLKADETKKSEDFDLLTFKIDVDEDSSNLVVTELDVVLNIDNASSTGTLDVNKFVQDMWIEVDGENYDDEFSTSTIGTAATDVVATFTIDEGDLEVEAGDEVEAVVYVVFGKQAGNYTDGTTIKATVDSDDMVAENEDGDVFDNISGSANGKPKNSPLKI